MWHKIAGRLSERYTVVLTDLRGYGDSSKPDGGPRHENYSSRAMALDQLEVMRGFGYPRFFLAAHDRGARMAHRMALDHPGALRRLCLMDIVPTLVAYRETNREFATRKMWWFFLIQKEPLPEHMIGADPDFFLNAHLEVQNGTPGALTDEAVAEYRRCFRLPQVIHASCEDYRAAAGVDFEMDEADEKAGHKIEAPLLVLWGSKGATGQLWSVPDVWRRHASGLVQGRALDAGHYLPEERPDEVLEELQRFFVD
jgi:haloacetate dehalogenase